MARLRNILALLLAVVMLAGCNKKVEWNQKLIVNVVTPEGLKTASSVITVMMQENKFFFDFLTPPEGRGVGTHVRGEAVVIEVKPGRFLFALLGDDKERTLKMFSHEIRLSGKPKEQADWPEYAINVTKLKGKRSVPHDLRPMLVTFGDINRPQTVREVKPNELSKHFGPGVSLASMTLEITDEPVTNGRVESVLGWLGEHPEPSLCPATGQTRNIPFCSLRSHGDFIRR